MIDPPAMTRGMPADGGAAAALIVTTDPPLFRHLGAGDPGFTLSLLEELWRRDDTVMSHSVARVARVERVGGVVGVLIAMPARQRGAMLATTNAVAAAIVPNDRTRAIFAAWTEVDWLAPAIPDDAYYVQNLAVAVPRRRTGLGARLLRSACDSARAAGLAAVHLDVAASNPAVAFYERHGFVKAVETHVPALAAHGIARHWRMVRDLASTAGPTTATP